MCCCIFGDFPGCNRLFLDEAGWWVVGATPRLESTSVGKFVGGSSGLTGYNELFVVKCWCVFGDSPAAVWRSLTGCNRALRGETCCRVFCDTPRLQSTSWSSNPTQSNSGCFANFRPCLLNLSAVSSGVVFVYLSYFPNHVQTRISGVFRGRCHVAMSNRTCSHQQGWSGPVPSTVHF